MRTNLKPKKKRKTRGFDEPAAARAAARLFLLRPPPLLAFSFRGVSLSLFLPARRGRVARRVRAAARIPGGGRGG